MQDRKALQAGTSHFLGQNFAKASGIKFQSTRAASRSTRGPRPGACRRGSSAGSIMTHGDDDGARAAAAAGARPRRDHRRSSATPRSRAARARVLPARSRRSCAAQHVRRRAGRASSSTSAICGGGEKSWQWVKKGVPRAASRSARATSTRRRSSSAAATWAAQGEGGVPRAELVAGDRRDCCRRSRTSLFDRARRPSARRTRARSTPKDEFYAFFTPKNDGKSREIHGGFALCALRAAIRPSRRRSRTT